MIAQKDEASSLSSPFANGFSERHANRSIKVRSLGIACEHRGRAASTNRSVQRLGLPRSQSAPRSSTSVNKDGSLPRHQPVSGEQWTAFPSQLLQAAVIQIANQPSTSKLHRKRPAGPWCARASGPEHRIVVVLDDPQLAKRHPWLWAAKAVILIHLYRTHHCPWSGTPKGRGGSWPAKYATPHPKPAPL